MHIGINMKLDPWFRVQNWPPVPFSWMPRLHRFGCSSHNTNVPRWLCTYDIALTVARHNDARLRNRSETRRMTIEQSLRVSSWSVHCVWPGSLIYYTLKTNVTVQQRVLHVCLLSAQLLLLTIMSLLLVLYAALPALVVSLEKRQFTQGDCVLLDSGRASKAFQLPRRTQAQPAVISSLNDPNISASSKCGRKLAPGLTGSLMSQTLSTRARTLRSTISMMNLCWC